MGRSSITQLVILQAIGLGVIAVAGSAKAIEHGSGGDRSPAAIMQFEERMASRTNVRGTLQCPAPALNSGAACTLQLVNRDTGEALRIVNSGTARKLFDAGQTQVVATGKIEGNDLRILDIRAE